MTCIAAAMAAVAGFVVGLPSLRLRGDYLAIVTLGFGEIIRIVVQNTDALGGSYALDRIPKIQPIWLVWLLAILCIAVSRNLIKTARGLTFLAVREDEIASAAMGVNVTRIKVTAFVLGSSFAGAAGALLAHYEGLITPTTFAMDVSFIILTMVVLGGTGSITGSVVAAAFLSYLPEYLRGLKAHNGEALVMSGASVVAGLIAVAIAVALIKRLVDSHWGTPKVRGATYVGIAVGGVALHAILAILLNFAKPLAAMQVEAGQLRMVIFAVTLIVLMLLRPQGIFAHHEFSWDWLLRRSPKPEVSV
jgi:branched-chain amino acid transport system permease protein